MKKLILIVLAFLFSGCLTVNRIHRNCDKFAQVCITETEKVIVYRDTVIYRNDTILVQLPRDTVKIIDTVRIINNRAYLPPVYKQFGLIGVDASVIASVLKINAYLTDSTILQPLRDTIVLKDAVKDQVITNTVTIEKRHIPKFYKFTFWFFIVGAGVSVAYIFVGKKLDFLFTAIRKIFGI